MTNSPTSEYNEENSSSTFELFSPAVQKWIWAKGWSGLHIIQEKAAHPIFEAKKDVIISAPTAGGKTEAAFFPIVSRVTSDVSGFQVLCLSPLKALINDQTERLESLCEAAGVMLTPWHGDVSDSKKQRALKKPQGILMITPESLEAMFVKRSSDLTRLYSNLKYIVIDEFHAFVGMERGIHLLSLLHRLETVLGREIPRVAMSATLGDMPTVANTLRCGRSLETVIVEDKTQSADLSIQIRGYLDGEEPDEDGVLPTTTIEDHLFKTLRGSSNLIFAGSRKNVEKVSDNLREQCEKAHVPNEFFPHHGNLSKSNRESLEHLLRDGKLPTTAVATTTLELGIDIGSVKSVAQIGPPRSISGLRQRVGRSGRRKGNSAVLRIYIEESPINSKDNLTETLRHNLIMAVASIQLLLKKWYEPPNIKELHLSTLVHQILSTIVEYGGISAGQLYSHLCVKGVFKNIEKALFVETLKQMGTNGSHLLEQSPQGVIFLGSEGEKITSRWDFFAVFETPEEYRVQANGQTLGTMPLQLGLQAGQFMIFAGRRWKVEDIFHESKSICVIPAAGGRIPDFEGAYGEDISDELIQEMFSVYCQHDVPAYCNVQAQQFLQEGRSAFASAKLGKENLFSDGDTTYLFPWVGSTKLNTLCAWLQYRGVKAFISSPIVIEVKANSEDLKRILLELLEKPLPSALDIIEQSSFKAPPQKFSRFLNDGLLAKEYAAGNMDIESLPLIAEKILH